LRCSGPTPAPVVLVAVALAAGVLPLIVEAAGVAAAEPR
jgi:hypothetical protein